jgi:hypothetical protein
MTASFFVKNVRPRFEICIEKNKNHRLVLNGESLYVSFFMLQHLFCVHAHEKCASTYPTTNKKNVKGFGTLTVFSYIKKDFLS